MNYPLLATLIASLCMLAPKASAQTEASSRKVVSTQTSACIPALQDWHTIEHRLFRGFQKLPGQVTNLGNFVKVEYTDHQSGKSHFVEGIIVLEYDAGINVVTADQEIVELSTHDVKFQSVRVKRGDVAFHAFAEYNMDMLTKLISDPYVIVQVPADKNGNYSLTHKDFTTGPEDLRYISGLLTLVTLPSGQQGYQIIDLQGHKHLLDPALLKEHSVRGAAVSVSAMQAAGRDLNSIYIRTQNEVRILSSSSTGVGISVSRNSGLELPARPTRLRRKNFDIGDVLSITTGRLVSTRLMTGVSDILGFMTSLPNITTLELVVVAEQCRIAILRQYPELGEVDHSHVNENTHAQFVKEMRRRFGDNLKITQLDPSLFRAEDFWERIRAARERRQYSGSSRYGDSSQSSGSQSEEVPDLYSLLEVDSQATKDQIKTAFRRLAKLYHPDHNPGNKASEEMFKKINGAFEVLGNPEKRRAYDRYR